MTHLATREDKLMCDGTLLGRDLPCACLQGKKDTGKILGRLAANAAAQEVAANAERPSCDEEADEEAPAFDNAPWRAGVV